jgi:uncharacterized protein involved in propanediol utilization
MIKSKNSTEDPKIRLTKKAYDRLVEIVDEMNAAGKSVNMKGVLSDLILAQPIPSEETKIEQPKKKVKKAA